MRSLILILGASLAACQPPCLDEGEKGTVERISREPTMVQSMTLKLDDGSNRVCSVPSGDARTIEPGDKFTGRFGGDNLGDVLTTITRSDR